MGTGGIIAIVIGAIVLLLAVIVAGMYNSFVVLRNDVEEGYSTMDVYLKKRYDLIPNLVETVKGYAKHEKETLTKVIEARNLAMSSNNVEEKIKNENALSGTLTSLFALSENYPDLKANQNFIDLQEQLKSVEQDIANARKYYNGVVKVYNNKIQVFPSNLFAGMFGFTKKPMFEVEDAEMRKNVKVEF